MSLNQIYNSDLSDTSCAPPWKKFKVNDIQVCKINGQDYPPLAPPNRIIPGGPGTFLHTNEYGEVVWASVPPSGFTAGFFVQGVNTFVDEDTTIYPEYNDMSAPMCFNSGMFDLDTSIATIPNTGRYFVSAALTFVINNNSTPNFGTNIAFDIEVNNGTTTFQALSHLDVYTSNQNDEVTYQTAATLFLTSGSTLRVKFSVTGFSPPGAAIINSPADASYFSIQRVV